MVKSVGPQPLTPKLIRQLWWLALAAALAILLASLPDYYANARVPQAVAVFDSWARIRGWLEIVLSLSAAGLCLGLAGLLFWKKRNEPMALFLSYYLLLNGIIIGGPMEHAVAYWLPQYPYLALQLQGPFFALFGVILILIFPNGHFVPRWSRVLVAIAALLTLPALALDAEEAVKLNTIRAQVLSGTLYSILLIAVGIQVYRYRRLYTPLERQQTKWVAYGSLVYFAFLVVTAIPYFFLLNLPPDVPPPWWLPDLGPLWWLGLNILPLSFTLAIFRSHLWDIDVIIRRTASYALITFTLALVYAGSVIVLQRAFSILTGVEQHEIVTVLSTLAIAALFVPLRNRIQAVIDKRFYRKKYDAQQVLNDFGKTVRDETDIEKLTARLMEVVNETMQPQSVSVWLSGDSVQKKSSIQGARK